MTDPAWSQPTNAPVASSIVDGTVRALLEEYVRLTGARLDDLAPSLLRLRLPAREAAAFRGRQSHKLALDLDTLDRHPDAVIPVIGSVFWDNLVMAVRQYGQRRVSGIVPINVTDDASTPDIVIVDAAHELVARSREARRIVRLTAKVTIVAGTAIKEEVVHGDVVDLSSGYAVPASVAALIDSSGEEQAESALSRPPAVAADRLVGTLIEGLEERIASEVEELKVQADRDLQIELRRIDNYFRARLEEVSDESGTGSAASRTVEAEHTRRRAEEIRRHEVRVNVEPLQVLERSVVVERATWRLTSKAGRAAELHAERYLTGDGAWGIHCPVCRVQPAELTVCRDGHAAGTECTTVCSVCDERFCPEHGHSACAIDGAPVCSEHSDQCWSCERVHCTTHTDVCAEGHQVCVECLADCAVCGRRTCRRHSTMSHQESPRGPRTLCGECVVFCEGATSEPVGRDEVEMCGTCDRFVCELHQTQCVVDERSHCSAHIRRTDRSRRFVCDRHTARCDHESREVVFATSEVHACVECGWTGCESHAAMCHADQRWHCLSHLESLTDDVNAFGCEDHRSICHVDGRVFSLKGTEPCDVCNQPTCRTHARTCEWCGARVCLPDMKDRRCITCYQLKEIDDLPDDVIAAVARVSGDARVKQRSAARDGRRFVVQLDQGWTRKAVITVPYGAATASRVVRHSLFGTKGLGP